MGVGVGVCGSGCFSGLVSLNESRGLALLHGVQPQDNHPT